MINRGRTNFIQTPDASLSIERYLPLKITPLMPNFGARIDGVDLRESITGEIKNKLREAFVRFGVLFFSNQETLSPQAQVEATRIFGRPNEGAPFVKKATKYVDLLVTDEDHPPYANLWHSDNTWFPEMSLGSLIQIQECPTVGGNTVWCSTQKAYECLSENMKKCLEGLICIHYWDHRGRSAIGSLDSYDGNQAQFEAYFENIKKYAPQKRPVVLVHPITGKRVIFVNETLTTFIVGLHAYESKGILDFLFNWIRVPEFQLVHHWQKNDVAVWDNFSMQHYALGDYKVHRVNQRVEFSVDESLDYGILHT